ncbi:60S ribosomal protein L36 [Schizosaccharomyces japonicus yFS275]|uniref:60S ribosomal protein L36 n=1 Tax=Schizosaccharomyces japonicus (strain yFS275 / FY16936) TaxID=402676 RepID=B6K3E9_SCHJY|nr:60S ribosomal protein L36 [Schizosaccharomyces japonicus yFS275]EEB08006.1 60S ribosomal protein L36 [Schizosaccharomyces japonicus yFS275]
MAPGLIVGLNKGKSLTKRQLPERPSRRKGRQAKRTTFVRSIVREVAGFAPYERRLMELIRNSQDKRARKLAKKRLGTLGRAKAKIEELSSVIQSSRLAH